MFSKKFLKLFSIYLFSFLLFSVIIVRSDDISDSESESDYESSGELIANKTLKSSNSSDYESSDDYESGDEEVANDDCPTENFIDKVKRIHEEGRKAPITKNVKHINETFQLLKNVRNVFANLFGITEREKHKVLEFLSEIDFKISGPCMTSLVRVFQAISNSELWAIKCESFESFFNSF